MGSIISAIWNSWGRNHSLSYFRLHKEYKKRCGGFGKRPKKVYKHVICNCWKTIFIGIDVQIIQMDSNIFQMISWPAIQRSDIFIQYSVFLIGYSQNLLHKIVENYVKKSITCPYNPVFLMYSPQAWGWRFLRVFPNESPISQRLSSSQCVTLSCSCGAADANRRNSNFLLNEVVNNQVNKATNSIIKSIVGNCYISISVKN